MGFENNIYFHAVLDPDPDGPSWVPALGAARSNFDKHVLGVPKNKKKCAQGESNPRQMLSTQIRNFWKASMLPLHHERFLVRSMVMKRHHKRLPYPTSTVVALTKSFSPTHTTTTQNSTNINDPPPHPPTYTTYNHRYFHSRLRSISIRISSASREYPTTREEEDASSKRQRRSLFHSLCGCT